MGATLLEWIGLVFRWLHVITGICWIGNSFYFMWLDSHLSKPKNKKDNVEGELWMTHSGGFYQVEKRRLNPGEVPKQLYWFKWESYMTWISGFFLMTAVYYMGGGIYLIDPSISDISVKAAITVCVSTLFASWILYDLLCNSPLSKNPKLLAFIGYLYLVAVAYFLTHTISGRAAFLHVGAVMGTIMSGNVLMRIIPAQRKMVAATQDGKKHNVALGKRAKIRSTHNNYMTLPVIFIMLSNHFPSTYGHSMNWLVLAGMILVGANVRHFFNVRNNTHISKPAILIPAAILFATLFYLVSPKTDDSFEKVSAAAATQVKSPGNISGTISFEGSVPTAKSFAVPNDCTTTDGAPVMDRSVLVKNGKLQNVFVSITKGLEDFSAETPEEEVLVDQIGCVYEPHVVGVQVGQSVRFLNSDTVFHNVRTVAKANPVFNEITPTKNTSILKKFMRPETMVNAKCDIHPWMGAYIGVVSHPYFAVSDANGEFSIKGVPAGTYTLEAWHEVYGRLTKEIKLSANGSVSANFKFK
jgi:uncharacterized membrane protein/plastocyanin